MCGIFAYVGPKDSTKVCLSGLKALEYRGYDSAGIAGISKGSLALCKEEGRVAVLEKRLTEKPLRLDLAIAHTRWATHGKPSQKNAHPHVDPQSKIAVVHNGIIENHFVLKTFLEKEGAIFSSDTDTEVIAHLVARFYQGDILAAVQQALSVMEGFWAFTLIHLNHQDTIIAGAKESPLCIALDPAKSESYVSSDPNAFSGQDVDVLFLKSGEVAVITAGEATVFDAKAQKIAKESTRLNLTAQTIGKGDFSHFMLKEIFEQPQTIQQAMQGRLLKGLGTAEFDTLTLSFEELKAIDRILIVGCGTSWHAGCIAAQLLEEMARIPTRSEIASELRYNNPIITEKTLVVAISQSGETLDTLAAVREAKRLGGRILGICNVAHSSLTREAHATILLRAGPEISVCSTKAFTSQITVLSLFSLLMARLRGYDQKRGMHFIEEIASLPKAVSEVLALRPAIQALAKKLLHYQHFFFLGRNAMFPTALEAALKLKEISYLFASGYPAGEMKHGPIALCDAGVAIIGMLGNRKTFAKALSNLQESKARGAHIVAFAPKQASGLETVADDICTLPETIDELAPIIYATATQLLAYEIALKLGREIDMPRNLAKSVTVE